MSLPESVAGYRILSELGRGAEGVVYLAESSDGLNKRVALKCFASAARFAHELEAYRRLEALRADATLGNLAEVLAAGELPGGGGFLALPYLPGGSLADRVKQAGPLAPEEARQIARQLLAGLEQLHAAGLCHRDVKPHNVLLDAQGQARLGDFGLSRDRDRSLSQGGTPAFSAPEQWVLDEADEPTPRSGVAIDVYGAGATLYYLLTARSPLPGAPDV
ncbi:MAG: serine/threonine protein kinase, partial [Planctomycetes bacterium]|nr:serine/threonine protein kinase [Planctomycetota bacterium]